MVKKCCWELVDPDHGWLVSQVMSKLEGKTIQDVIHPHVRATCQDLDALEKTLKLALLCSKLNPSHRPSMYDVSQVLLSLLPMQSETDDPMSKSSLPANQRRYIDMYSTKHTEAISLSNSSSGDTLLYQFKEVISGKLWKTDRRLGIGLRCLKTQSAPPCLDLLLQADVQSRGGHPSGCMYSEKKNSLIWRQSSGFVATKLPDFRNQKRISITMPIPPGGAHHGSFNFIRQQWATNLNPSYQRTQSWLKNTSNNGVTCGVTRDTFCR